MFRSAFKKTKCKNVEIKIMDELDKSMNKDLVKACSISPSSSIKQPSTSDGSKRVMPPQIVAYKTLRKKMKTPMMQDYTSLESIQKQNAKKLKPREIFSSTVNTRLKMKTTR